MTTADKELLDSIKGLSMLKFFQLPMDTIFRLRELRGMDKKYPKGFVKAKAWEQANNGNN